MKKLFVMGRSTFRLAGHVLSWAMTIAMQALAINASLKDQEL
jgi:hypothetical protein